jgi:hypothetical protein
MPFKTKGLSRFKSRRDAERALAEIVEDGGHAADYRIEEDSNGRCVIIVLERDGGVVAGMLGA